MMKVKVGDIVTFDEGCGYSDNLIGVPMKVVRVKNNGYIEAEHPTYKSIGEGAWALRNGKYRIVNGTTKVGGELL